MSTELEQPKDIAVSEEASIIELADNLLLDVQSKISQNNALTIPVNDIKALGPVLYQLIPGIASIAAPEKEGQKRVLYELAKPERRFCA